MKEYKFYQNKNCPFFPQEGNDQACHWDSNPEWHNCIFCFCPLYFLLQCPSKANPQWLDSGIKDCSECLFPHKPKNYDQIIEILINKLNVTKLLLGGKNENA